MPEKQKKFLKIFGVALLASVLTLVVKVAVLDPQDASAGVSSQPETSSQIEAKVEEITQRILSGGDYGFNEVLYVMDNDKEAGDRIVDYLVEQGKTHMDQK